MPVAVAVAVATNASRNANDRRLAAGRENGRHRGASHGGSRRHRRFHAVIQAILADPKRVKGIRRNLLLEEVAAWRLDPLCLFHAVELLLKVLQCTRRRKLEPVASCARLVVLPSLQATRAASRGQWEVRFPVGCSVLGLVHNDDPREEAGETHVEHRVLLLRGAFLTGPHDCLLLDKNLCAPLKVLLVAVKQTIKESPGQLFAGQLLARTAQRDQRKSLRQTTGGIEKREAEIH